MKTMKKLHVAVAIASLIAANTAMAASISQSGVTIAREAVSPTSTTQTLTAPSVSFNYTNGPTANAASSQDFSITLELASTAGAAPIWTNLNPNNIWHVVNAKRQNTAGSFALIGPTTPAPGGAFIRLLDVQLDPSGSATSNVVRYFFRLENPTAASVSLSDLALEFNSVNSTFAGPFPQSDYAKISGLANAVSPIVGSRIDTTGTGPGCANDDSGLTVRARNFIGSGFTAPEGESSGSVVINRGYVLFAQALNIRIGRAEGGIVTIPNRNTDPLAGNASLTSDISGFGDATRMPLGFLQFKNVPVDAWDLSVQQNYYKYRKPITTVPTAAGDLGTFGTTNINGDIDVSAVRVVIKSTNGFQAGSAFALTNSPYGTGPGSPPVGTTGGAVGSVVFSTDTTGPAGNLNIATVTFSHANLVAAANATTNDTLLGSTGAGAANATYYPLGATTDRFYLHYITGGGAIIPQSAFTGTVTLVKEGAADEQNNLSCPGELAGLGGGVKVDVRNFFPYNPANPGNEWVGVLRVINNSETVAADLTGQYIRADGKYGQWGSMGVLPARGARYFLSSEIYNLLNQNTTTTLPKDNTGSGGITADPATGALPANTRLRISSAAASTIRVQSYIYNAVTRALVEVSGSQGADFVNIEAAPRDHIDQDAQTGIKK
jgi:hypothetical protein